MCILAPWPQFVAKSNMIKDIEKFVMRKQTLMFYFEPELLALKKAPSIDLKEPVTVSCDASKHGLGTTLCVLHG